MQSWHLSFLSAVFRHYAFNSFLWKILEKVEILFSEINILDILIT